MADRDLFRGDTMVFLIQVLQTPPGALPGTPGIPQNITGWKFWCTGKKHISDPDLQAVFQVTTVNGGIIIIDGLNGKAQITIPASSTLNFPDGDVVLQYDVQGMDLTNAIFTVERGTITVHPDVTRALS